MLELPRDVSAVEEVAPRRGPALPTFTLRAMLTAYSVLSLLLSVAAAFGPPGWLLFWFCATPVILLTLLTVLQWPIFWMLRSIGSFEGKPPRTGSERVGPIDSRDAFPALPRER